MNIKIRAFIKMMTHMVVIVAAVFGLYFLIPSYAPFILMGIAVVFLMRMIYDLYLLDMEREETRND